MKKLLLSAAMLLFGASAFAWNVGEEITDQVTWGNLSFQSSPMDYWTFEGTGSTTQTGGLFESYSGSDINLYQIVELKAGMYRLECQGYYRCGNSWATDPAAFNTDQWENNAQLYVQNGTYDITSQEFLPGRTFQCPLMPRLFDFQADKIYDMAAAGDADPGWDMSDGQYGDNGSLGWGPCSVPGSLAWFNAGKYKPYNEDGVKYNTVSFFVTADGYVKLGVSKIATKSEDSFMVTNFRLYYEGEAGEAVELAALQDEIADCYEKAQEVSDTHEGLIQTLTGDAIIEFDDTYPRIEDLDKEGLKEALKVIQDIYMNASNAVKSLEALQAGVASMTNLANSTSYPGKSAFEKAIALAASYTNTDYEYDESHTFNTLQEAYDALVEARGIYLQSQEAVNGAYDYTAFIAYPWFCLPQYEPTWSEEEQRWIPNQDVLDMANGTDRYDNGNLTHTADETWGSLNDINGTGANVALGVNVNSKKGTLGAWYQEGTEGGGLEVYWNDKLTCIKKWDMPHEGYHDVSQVVGGIPNGYYKLKALAQTWSNDWNGNCRLQIYIKSSTMESFSPYLEPGGWWANDINEWKELETEMIEVTDGQVLISSRDNGFAAFTGFRLYYYGETPDFSGLITNTLENAKNAAENLEWAGDRAAANEILASIPEKITSSEEYQFAMECIADVNDYVAKANNAINNFKQNTLTGFENLVEQFAEGTAENEMASTAYMANILLGEDVADTYEAAEAAAKILDSYKSYFAAVSNAKAYSENAELMAILNAQANDLKANYATVEKLAEYMAAIAAPYNKAVLAALGADKASKDNPIDVTTLIVNPKYDEDQKGWSGDNLTFNFDPSSVEKPHTAEKWNTNFDSYQTIYSLPAGNYRVQVQAIYRDGGDANTAWKNWQAAAEDMEFWDNQNAKVYANENESSICSMASYKSATRSMDSFRDKMVEAPEADEQGNIIWIEHWNYQFKQEVTDPETGVITYEDLDEDSGKNDWWWDNKIFDELDEAYYFFPASLWGISQRFAKSPEAYINTVDVYIEEGGSIKLGVRKENLIGNDWVVMDNWKLFYLGTDVPEAIEGVSNSAAAQNIYSVSGIRQNAMQKGINIVKTADGKVSKVLVK